MYVKVRLGLALVILLALCVSHGSAESAQATAYVDPRALEARSRTISAIITGTNGQAAADAVKRIGGRMESNLWLIDAVTATIPTQAVTALANDPAIRSIMMNGRVRSSNAEGWVSGAREFEGSVTLPAPQWSPASILSDGSFVSVGEKGNVIFFNDDGKALAQVKLAGEPFKTAPLVVGDAVFIASETKVVYRLDRTGKVLWTFKGNTGEKSYGGLTIGQNGVLYIVDDKGLLSAIDSATGKQRWSFSAANTGTPYAAPAVGSDGTIYFTTDKGYVYAVHATGTRRWMANTATQLKLEPLFGPNGTVHVASTDGMRLFSFNAVTGARLWTFATIGKIIAKPIVASDGSIYFGTEDGLLYAIHANGSQRFTPLRFTGHFKTSPTLSREEDTLYIALTENIVFAIDTFTGVERWRYRMSGNIQGGLVLDADNGIIIGSDGLDLVRLDAHGRVTFKSRVTDKISQAGATNQFGDTMVRVGDTKVMTIGRLPDTWDGDPDVQATSDPKVWKVANPAPIDVGADVVHRTTLSGSTVIKGNGVTVAVVDSGVYFDSKIKASLGGVVDTLYKGQVDFVDTAAKTCVAKGGVAGDDDEDDGDDDGDGDDDTSYCSLNATTSVDPYGHGTAVASVIWNNLTDYDTGVALGIAPNANILSVRVLDENGSGTYEQVIEGIQYVVANKAALNIRVMNLSMSSDADVPYFVDPINRAVEQAWAKGIVVVTAAGNNGPTAESVSAPGNDPYVITVGAINSNRTPGYWTDDFLPTWSGTGPTGDGFAKPDILAPGANVVTFMYRDAANMAKSQRIVQIHPDNSLTPSLFRMNGTSLSSPIVAGVVALMLQAKPTLTPDQVKYRLLASARSAITAQGDQALYNPFQQGAGRIWAPDAVLGTWTEGDGNPNMDLAADLAHGYATDSELAFHYQGPVQKVLSDDGQTWLYYTDAATGADAWLGMASADGLSWIEQADSVTDGTTWNSGRMSWGSNMLWEGGTSTSAGRMSWGTGRMSWGTGRMSWGTGRMSWGTGRMSWGTGRMSWGTGRMSWGTTIAPDTTISSTSWIGDWYE